MNLLSKSSIPESRKDLARLNREEPLHRKSRIGKSIAGRELTQGETSSLQLNITAFNEERMTGKIVLWGLLTWMISFSFLFAQDGGVGPDDKVTTDLINSPRSLERGQDHLNQYLQEAAQKNPELKAQYRQYLSALEQVPQVKALPDPKLSFGYFVSPVETRVGPQRAKVELQQMFPWFGTLNARAGASAQTAKAKFEAFQEVRNNLFYRVKKTWYERYRIEQSIRIMQENINILESFESLVIKKYETNQAGQSDVLRVQIEKEDLKTQLELQKDNRKVINREFNELLNRQNTEPVYIPDTLESPTLERSIPELEKAVLQQNPKLTEADYKASSARNSVEAARKEGLPSLGVKLDYIVTGKRNMALSDNGRDAVMGWAKIQVPLSRGKYRAKKRQAELELRAVKDRQSATENRLQTQLEQTLRDYHDGQRHVALYTNIQIQRTQQTIDLLTEEYATATADFEELLRLQRKLLQYELSQIDALVDQHTAVAYLEYLYGKYNVNTEDIELKN